MRKEGGGLILILEGGDSAKDESTESTKEFCDAPLA